jgi:hypothetical protein
MPSFSSLLQEHTWSQARCDSHVSFSSLLVIALNIYCAVILFVAHILTPLLRFLQNITKLHARYSLVLDFVAVCPLWYCPTKVATCAPCCAVPLIYTHLL